MSRRLNESRTDARPRALVASIALAIAVLLLLHPARAVVGLPLPLRRIAEIPLPGTATRLDYQSLDPRRHRLFIAHLGAGRVIVFNTRQRRVTATIPDIQAVHGVLAVPALDTLYASATGANEVVAIDESSLHVKWRSPGGVYPDGIAYDPQTRRIFISDEAGGTDTVVDAVHGRRLATIGLGGEVGNTQYDPRSHTMFVNAEGMEQLVQIDPVTLRIRSRTALPGCEGAHGLLIDARRQRAFVACENNARLLLIDMRTMQETGNWAVGDDPDVLALDSLDGVLYVSSESGVVSLFRDGNAVRQLARGFLAPEAHTVAVEPGTPVTYWPLQDVDGRPVLRIMRLTSRARR